jgi:hypothetical protein
MPLDLPWQGVLLGVLLFAVTFVGSLAVVACVLVQLPATYFCRDHPPAIPGVERHPLVRWTALVLKNLLGVVVVAVGVLLSLPGVPGQGLLTILLGVMLLNFPGKRRLERKLVSRPRVRAGINRLRARFGKPPLVLDEPAATTREAPQH